MLIILAANPAQPEAGDYGLQVTEEHPGEVMVLLEGGHPHAEGACTEVHRHGCRALYRMVQIADFMTAKFKVNRTDLVWEVSTRLDKVHLKDRLGEYSIQLFYSVKCHDVRELPYSIVWGWIPNPKMGLNLGDPES